jgi:hypothetical protein
MTRDPVTGVIFVFAIDKNGNLLELRRTPSDEWTAPGRITASPAQLSFGALLVNTTSSPQTVSVTNSGAQPFPLLISVTGDYIEAHTCGPTLGANDTCTIRVSFAPKDVGIRAGTITFGDGAPEVALTGSATTPQAEPVLCYVFNDGYTAMAGPKDAIYISGRLGDRGQACVPDGTANGQCRKWFGRCFGANTGRPVTFSVFDDGTARVAGPTDAIFINGQNSACEPGAGAAGICRKWFGLGSASDGRVARCSVFNDGYANRSAISGAIYIPTPLPAGGSACIPDGTANGTCRRWFGQCQLQ